MLIGVGHEPLKLLLCVPQSQDLSGVPDAEGK